MQLILIEFRKVNRNGISDWAHEKALNPRFQLLKNPTPKPERKNPAQNNGPNVNDDQQGKERQLHEVVTRPHAALARK
ncbi:MAG: hypothetical protein ACI87A_001480 [Planctomycetota bacterium]